MWGQKITKEGNTRIPERWRGRPGVRWDDAERSLFTELTVAGIRDVYRELNGFQEAGYSWVMKRKGREFWRRFDHIFASHALVAKSCKYLHEPRLCALSDHAPLMADFIF